MTIDEAKSVINELKLYVEDLDGYSVDEVTEALSVAIKILDQNHNHNFEEVVDFFNDIMDTLYQLGFPFGESPDKVRFARSVVYKVFSRRYKIKEIEKNEKK